MPQNTRPTPMPQPNSMANQDMSEYSGFESSGPSLMFPQRENAMASTNTTNASMTTRYSQPKSTVRKAKTASETTVKFSLNAMAHTAMIAHSMSETRKTGFLNSFFFMRNLVLSAIYRFRLAAFSNANGATPACHPAFELVMWNDSDGPCLFQRARGQLPGPFSAKRGAIVSP